ncbi:MAG: RDD family protein [Ilumatobacteraceae bacterium]
MSSIPPPPGSFPTPPGTPPPYGDQPRYGMPPGPMPAYGSPPPPPYGYQPYSPGPALGQFASFGARLGAVLIDGLIGVLFYVPGLIVLFAGPKHIGSCTINEQPALCNIPDGSTIALAVALFVIGIVVYLIIYCRRAGAGQSWGQQALHVRVVDAQTGQPIGTGRTFGRTFARILSGAVCYLGYLWMLWDPRKQTWHDKIVGTVVVRG